MSLEELLGKEIDESKQGDVLNISKSDKSPTSPAISFALKDFIFETTRLSASSQEDLINLPFSLM